MSWNDYKLEEDKSPVGENDVLLVTRAENMAIDLLDQAAFAFAADRPAVHKEYIQHIEAAKRIVFAHIGARACQ